MPSAVVIPTACFVSKIIVTLPSAGAQMTSPEGRTANPGPMTPEENTWSSMAESSTSSPSTGEETSTSWPVASPVATMAAACMEDVAGAFSATGSKSARFSSGSFQASVSATATMNEMAMPIKKAHIGE